MLLNCDVGEDSWEPLDCKEIKPVNSKGNQSWILIGGTEAEAEAPILWPHDIKSQPTGIRPWWWERLRAGREGEDRGRDGWMTSLTQWTWVWTSTGKWARTGKPDMLQSSPVQLLSRVWLFETPWTAASQASLSITNSRSSPRQLQSKGSQRIGHNWVTEHSHHDALMLSTLGLQAELYCSLHQGKTFRCKV